MESRARRSSRRTPRQGFLSEATAQLPSPSSSLRALVKREQSEDPPKLSKKVKSCKDPNDREAQRIAHWAENDERNVDLPPDETMVKRSRSASATSRRTRHRPDYLASLENHGIYMDDSPQVKEESRIECEELLSGKREEHVYSHFSKVFPDLLQTIKSENKDRIRRDLGEWCVPSPATLLLLGELDYGLNQLNEKINAEWTGCELMGGTCPKPDFVVGFSPSAFTAEERLILEDRAGPRKLFEVTPGLCFPFLICEVETGETGLKQAQRQNLHSGAIAVRAIVELYKDAFGINSKVLDKDIYGKVLCFSISHNCSQVVIHGHYALLDAQKQTETYHCQFIEAYHLQKPEQRLKPYNFSLDLYKSFSEKHKKRMRRAIARLKDTQTFTNSTSQEREDSGTPEPILDAEVALEMAKLGLLIENQKEQLADFVEALNKVATQVRRHFGQT